MKGVYNIFDLYDKCDLSGISFTTFYAALLVFAQLELVSIIDGETISIRANKNVKKELSMSSIYNKLMLIKHTQKGESDARRSKTNS